MNRGRFIVLEGGEASGKSTQAERLAAALGAVLTREPGGTPIGERIRSVVLDPTEGDALDPRAEALLVAADRAHHVRSVVLPALEAGRHVVSDRYAGSSLAYQGYGRGLPLEEVRQLSDWASGGLWPDLVILLDIDVAESMARLRRSGSGLDRMEAEGMGFHEQVMAGFREIASSDPRWVTVDGRGSPDEVAERVRNAVNAFFA